MRLDGSIHIWTLRQIRRIPKPYVSHAIPHRIYPEVRSQIVQNLTASFNPSAVGRSTQRPL
jgi:hypothetical protein